MKTPEKFNKIENSLDFSKLVFNICVQSCNANDKDLHKICVKAPDKDIGQTTSYFCQLTCITPIKPLLTIKTWHSLTF